MSFGSFEFLIYFLPSVLLLFHFLHGKYRIATLTLVSYLFYLWGSPVGAVILFFTSIVDYYFVFLFSGFDGKFRKILVCFLLAENVGILLYFKYLNFFVVESNSLLNYFDYPPILWNCVIFPMGVSFFVFHKISYVVDVYQRQVPPADNFVDYSLYLVFFPKLIQGPIICYHDYRQQQFSKWVSSREMFDGVLRFCLGLSKKILIADPMGRVADLVFDLKITDLTIGYSWLGAVCYTLQIYFDFSGYSDMAIGLGKMLGFRINENFNRPYIAQSFTEFWRRWHITLSNWFKNYLYIPLGGNRKSEIRTYFNLWVVFLISGFWHGANWTFALWGAFHGFFLVVDKLFWLNTSRKMSKLINIPLTFMFVVLGWVIFRSTSVSSSFAYICRMFYVLNHDSISSTVLLVDLMSNRQSFVLFVALLICFLPEKYFLYLQRTVSAHVGKTYYVVTAFVLMVFLLSASFISMVNNAFQPFIYLRF